MQNKKAILDIANIFSQNFKKTKKELNLELSKFMLFNQSKTENIVHSKTQEINTNIDQKNSDEINIDLKNQLKDLTVKFNNLI